MIVANRPVLDEKVVVRANLLTRIKTGSRLTIIRALAGFGKSTLAATWADEQRSTGAAVAWVVVAPGNDAAAILAAVAGTLSRQSVIDTVGERETTAETARALGHAINLAEDMIRVVVDNVEHAVDDAAVLTCLEGLAAMCPRLHIVVCGRPVHGDAASAVGYYRAGASLLWGSDLAIASGHAMEYADAWGHAGNAELVQCAHELTHGWPQLMRLVLDRPSSDPPNVPLTALSFLRDQVVSQSWPASTHATLRALSVLDVFDAQDVHVASGLNREDGIDSLSAAAIAPGELARAFAAHGVIDRVAEGGTGARWKFAPLVRDVLRTGADELPDQGRTIRAALAWALFHRDQWDRLPEVLRLAREAREWALLARLWARNLLTMSADFPEAYKTAYEKLPHAALESHPVLATAEDVAALLGPNATQRDVNPTLTSLDIARMRRMSLAELDSVEDVLGVTSSVMLGLRRAGRHHDAVAAAHEAERELMRRGHHDGAAATRLAQAWFLFQWSRALLLAGDTPGSIRLAQRTLDVTTRADFDFIRAAAAAQLLFVDTRRATSARITAEWRSVVDRTDITRYWFRSSLNMPARIADAWRATDRLDEAGSQRLIDALSADASTSHELWVCVLEAQVRHCLAFGQPARAWNKLDQALTHHADQMVPGGLAFRIVNRYRAEVLLAAGDATRAKRLIESLGTKDQSAEVPHWLDIPYARLLLLSGSPGRARTHAEPATWRDDITPRDRIELNLILAAAAHLSGDRDAAAQAFAHAYDDADAAEISHPFATIPAEILDALVRDTGLTVVTNRRQQYPAKATLVDLTRRELEVLRMLAHHEGASQIARELTVSVNTVKKQVAAVYAKLNVHDRESALNVARRLDLLP